MENENEEEPSEGKFRVISCELVASNVTLIGGPVIVMNDGPSEEDSIH